MKHKVFYKLFLKNNFLLGLVLGALLSFLVNLLNLQVQEALQKQKTLEALEYEIAFNYVIAENVKTGHLEKQAKISPNDWVGLYPKSPTLYSDDVWKTSEVMKYRVQLNSDVQAKLNAYYAYDVSDINKDLKDNYDISIPQLSTCYINLQELTSEAQSSCNGLFKSMVSLWGNTAIYVSDESLEMLKIFHPTKDRLSNPLMRALIGSKDQVVYTPKGQVSVLQLENMPFKMKKYYAW